MNKEQLQNVWQTVRAVEHAVSTAGRMLSQAKYKTTAEFANKFMEDTSTRRDKRTLISSEALLDLTDPVSFFYSYGESGRAIYRMLRDAQDLARVRLDDVVDRVRKIVKPDTVREHQTTRHEFETERGDRLTLTTAQIMGLYNLSRRDQAQNHLLLGGVVQPEIKGSIKRRQGKIERGTKNILLNGNDLSKIFKVVTGEQIKIAEKLQRLTTGPLADWGNEASMAVYGNKKFTDPNYWMIHAAKEGVHSSIETGEGNVRSIKNIGFAKSVVPHASNAIEITDIYEDLARHAADMIDYSVWLAPMEDANRLFNYQYKNDEGVTVNTFKGELDRVGGKGSQKYWHTLMSNIQNGMDGKAGGLDRTVNRIVGNAKGAAVGANIRVVIQQPTAWFRALCVMDAQDLAHGALGGVTEGNGWEKAKKYAPIARIKDVGGFDQGGMGSVAREMYDTGTALDKLSEASGFAAGAADAFTWGKLWNASEWQVKRQNPNLTAGSAEFYSKTAEVFTDMIDQTQVVDGVLQRAQIMRKGDGLAKQATSFMGESLKSLNLLIRSWDQLRYEESTAKRAQAVKQLKRVVAALVITDVVNALAQSIADGWRDDDEDKKYLQRLWSAFSGQSGEEKNARERAGSFVMNSNVLDNMNPLGRIPYVKDALSIWKGFRVERMEASIFRDLVQAATGFAENASGTGKKTPAYAVKQLLTAAARMGGVSVQNLTQDVWAIARSIAVETDNIPLQYEMEKAIYNLSNSGNNSRYYAIMYRALEQEDYDSYNHIREDLMRMQPGEDGVTGAKIDNAMKSRYLTARDRDQSYELPQRARDLIGGRTQISYEPQEEEDPFGKADLDSAAYQAFSEKRGAAYRKLEDGLLQNQDFRGLDAESQDKALEAAYKLAEKRALEDVSEGRYQVDDTWMKQAGELERTYKIPAEVCVLLHVKAGGIESIRDKDGNAVANSKGLRLMEMVYDTPGLNLNKRQRRAVFEFLGVGKTVIDEDRASVKTKLRGMEKGAGK